MFGSLRVSCSEEAFGSDEVPKPSTAAKSPSSDEADSSESTLGSPTHDLTPVADGQYQVYSDPEFLNDKVVMTRTLTLKWRVLTGSLPTMQEIHNHFTRHQQEWTTRLLKRYIEKLVREFYASYVATLISLIDRRTAPAKQATLDPVRVRGIQVDVSLPSIRRRFMRRGC